MRHALWRWLREWLREVRDARRDGDTALAVGTIVFILLTVGSGCAGVVLLVFGAIAIWRESITLFSALTLALGFLAGLGYFLWLLAEPEHEGVDSEP